MHICIKKISKFSKFSQKCDIGYDFKTTVHHYIKEQRKFASFLGVEGGGAKQPSEVSNIYL